MENREEKIKVIHRITKSSSACLHGDNKSNGNEVFSNHDHIPIDLTREIIMRLPAKSIVRFRCVSKLWWSITTQPNFINSFAIRQSSIPRQNLLITFVEQDNGKKQVFCMLPIHKNSTSYSDVNNFHIIFPPTKVFCGYYTISVNGLITFRTNTEIIIWNPTMREHITFIKPKSSKHARCFLGYDSTENTYKLLLMACSYRKCEKYQKPEILTLGSQESWRVIENSPAQDPKCMYYCINGILYYNAVISFEEDRDDHSILPSLQIMSFDVRSELFKSIQLPGRANQYQDGLMLEESLISYQRKLAWVCYNSKIIKIWVLKDAEKQVWLENEFVLPLPQRDLPEIAWLHGATSTGEFIYVSGNAPKDISTFYYDPVRETIRSVKGIEYEQFRRCYGSNDNFVSSLSLHAFPDHIENLMSLKHIMCSPSV